MIAGTIAPESGHCSPTTPQLQLEEACLPLEQLQLSSETRYSVRCCRRKKDSPILDANPEAIAWALDTVATAIIFVGSGAFLATTLIKVCLFLQIFAAVT